MIQPVYSVGELIPHWLHQACIGTCKVKEGLYVTPCILIYNCLLILHEGYINPWWADGSQVLDEAQHQDRAPPSEEFLLQKTALKIAFLCLGPAVCLPCHFNSSIKRNQYQQWITEVCYGKLRRVDITTVISKFRSNDLELI